ncbi:MAG: Stp1/IreP family PP2C-type Ser/Thr phosphatase [Deltaproteobacteria bacterium]|nr:Stp1/IreP family PP2C-type Ser/Thr phosphatase [Deltaproteobacteria bacterium]
MELRYWAATDVGRQRDHNEDNFLIDKKLQLFVVADGMGGHASGEVASSMAVHEVRDALRERRSVVEGFDAGDPSISAPQVLRVLEQAVQQACSAINRRAQSEPEKRGMGTTCSLLLLAGPPGKLRGFIAHVGDSRAYLLRKGHVHQLTEDHSLMNELIRRGKIKREDIESSPYSQYKNAVTRAVGVYESVEVDTFDFDALPGDSYLLCSDGLYPYFSEEEFGEFLGDEDVNEIPKRLIDKANEGGGHDNITAICVRLADTEAAAEGHAEDVALKLEVLKGMPLFKHLSYMELVRVMNITSALEVSAGERIFREGEAGEQMFVILKGKVRLHKGDTTIASLGKGAHFGEMALVDRSPRSLCAEAEEPGRLLSLRRQDFYEVVRKEPQTSVKLLWSFVQVLAERLRKTTADLSGARAAVLAEDMSDEVLFDE